jgi:hypothetical protein
MQTNLIVASFTSLALLAGCATALALPTEQDVAATDASTLRAQGPAALQRLLARWDAMPAGAARDELARTIDQVAAQRYATTSRLYWYTDFATAQAAARAANKPILSLRMLGRLDEDLSCANSRLFRATLYANTRISKLLRDNFILYWSSERTVPRVTIDFGAGRKLESTTTGNSAHYVLSADGDVLDVLPGLYAPQVFEAELTKSLGLARMLSKLEVSERSEAISTYHRKALSDVDRVWAGVATLTYLEGRDVLLGDNDVASALALAQRATISKAYIEVPQLAMIGALHPSQLPDDSSAMWAAIGQYAWKIGRVYVPQATQKEARDAAFGNTISFGPRRFARSRPAITSPEVVSTLPRVLDDASRAVVTRLHDAGPVRSTAEQRAVLIARLERHLVADSALNEFKLRTQLHRYLADNADRSFERVNTYVYSDVFHTPAGDAWLGLLPRTDFTGLPGDGAVVP